MLGTLPSGRPPEEVDAEIHDFEDCDSYKDLPFVFVVYFIRAQLRGASLGTRLSGGMDRS